MIKTLKHTVKHRVKHGAKRVAKHSIRALLALIVAIAVTVESNNLPSLNTVGSGVNLETNWFLYTVLIGILLTFIS